MLGYLTIFLFFLMFASTLTILFHKRIEITLPSSFLFIILYLFVFGFFIPLSYLAYFGIAFVFLSFLYAIFKWRRKKLDWVKEYLFSKTLLLFLIFYLVICIINMGKHVAYIDEYTHWADVVKGMVQTHQLSVYQEGLWYASYPPAISLLQYFIMILNGAFQEDLLYIINQIFMISLFFPFLKKENKYSFVLLIPLIFISPMIFVHNYYDTIYVDAYLGILFAHNLVYIFSHKELNRFDFLYLMSSSIVLTLTKDIGIFFSLFALLILFWMHVKADVKERLKLLILILLTVGSRLLLSFFLFLNQVPLKHQNSISFMEIIRILTFQGNKNQFKIIGEFWNKICRNSIITTPINLNYISILAVFLILFLSFKKYFIKDKKEQLWFLRIQSCLLSGAVIYVIGLLFMYLFQMNPRDAMDLSSYDRYIVIFINGIFFFFCFLILEFKIERKKFQVILLILVCFMPMYQVPSLFQKRNEFVLKDIVLLGKEIDQNSKLMIFNYEGGLYEKAQVHYYIRPFLLDDASYVGRIEDLSSLGQYDYLYIQKLDSNLSNYLLSQYHTKVEEKGLYQITNKKLILQKKY